MGIGSLGLGALGFRVGLRALGRFQKLWGPVWEFPVRRATIGLHAPTYGNRLGLWNQGLRFTDGGSRFTLALQCSTFMVVLIRTLTKTPYQTQKGTTWEGLGIVWASRFRDWG